MATDAELAFADQVARYFARQYGLPPMIGRVAGWLMICDPPEQTAAEIAEALGVSRSGVGTAVGPLENQSFVRRSRRPGDRADRIGFNPAAGEQALDAPEEYRAMRDLARHGLELLGDAPPARRARLLETVALHDFLLERMPALAAEWRRHRDKLRASGELPS